MTLDEAIEHAREVADQGCGKCAEEHSQLADWLKELQMLKKESETMSCKYCSDMDYGKAGDVYFDEYGNSASLVWFPGEPMPTLVVNLKNINAEDCAGIMVPCCPICGRNLV